LARRCLAFNFGCFSSTNRKKKAFHCLFACTFLNLQKLLFSKNNVSLRVENALHSEAHRQASPRPQVRCNEVGLGFLRGNKTVSFFDYLLNVIDLKAKERRLNCAIIGN
jgi:hypothetical protein